MKRKLLICSSLITLLLSVFYVPIFAEETAQDSSNLHSLSDGVFLDSYFYSNYDPLLYLEATGSQYIDTGIPSSSTLKVELYMSDLVDKECAIFGSTVAGKNLLVNYSFDGDSWIFYFGSGQRSNTFTSYPYSMIHIIFDRNNAYLNNNLIHIGEFDFEDGRNMFIFARNINDPNNLKYGEYKLYKFSIYDYSLNDGEGGYLRYYYPAKAKTSGTLGLYDAVSKTFFTSSGAQLFIDPTDDYVENFQISSFLTNSLTWIGQIFTAIIQMPLIIVFMAIGLAGAMFRWGRRIVHF